VDGGVDEPPVLLEAGQYELVAATAPAIQQYLTAPQQP
jgi:hypothetical protein